MQWAYVLPREKQVKVGVMFVRRGLLGPAATLPYISYRLLLDGYQLFKIPIPSEFIKILKIKKKECYHHATTSAVNHSCHNVINNNASIVRSGSTYVDILSHSQAPLKLLELLQSQTIGNK